MAASHTRKQTAKEKAREQESLDSGIRVTYDEKSYTIRQGDIPARVGMEVRRQTGMSIRAILEACNTDPDIDLLAALLWLGKYLAGETTSFAQVAAEVTYDTDIDIVELSAGDEDPEASGGPLSA